MRDEAVRSWVIKGDICFSRSREELETAKDSYLICVDGKCRGVFPRLPEEYKGLLLRDYTGFLVIPGMTDLHLHGPQYAFRGLGMDLELLEWLETHTFPEESRYADLSYAKRAYEIFAKELKRSETTRAVVFGTVHVEATELLMDLLEKTGLETLVGKVNMDRNCPDSLCEAGAEDSLEATRRWLLDCMEEGRYRRTRPILTPRFIPSCSDALMRGLGELQRFYELPVQSHLSENLSEIEWVRELCPWSACYADAYGQPGLLQTNGQTIMAHCVYSSKEELELLKENQVYIAHCPQSNTNLASGIAPVRRYLDCGMNVGLGSDVAGGASLSMFRCMEDAVAVSKLRWRLEDQSLKPLTVPEVFYLATAGGGSFFGKVGSFQEGYLCDAVIVDDSDLLSPRELSVRERVERLIFLHGEGGRVVGKYVNGRAVL